MPKHNEITFRAFAHIDETPKKKAGYTTFLGIDKLLGVEESEILKELKALYHEQVYDTKGTISSLATLEEIIIQIRCKEVVDSEIRLTLSRNYIYARTLFYRRTNEINDIRVMIGKTEEYGEDLNLLLQDVTFKKLAVSKLLFAMDNEIAGNLLTLKTLTRV